MNEPDLAGAREQAQRRDRLRRPPLVEHERHEQDGGDGERGDRDAVAPAVGRGPDEGVDERGHADRRGDGARQVEAAGRAGRLGDEQRGEHGHRDADRHVDEQHPAPGGPLGDQAAEHQAERAARGHHAGVDGQRPDPLPAFGEAADHERQDGGRGEGAADALDGAGGEQHAGVRREAAGQRTEGEDRDAGQEHAAAAEDVAGPAAEQQQAAEGQRVPVHHPGQAGRGEVQPGLDVRQRDVHDGGVENDHQLRAEHDRQCDARASARAAPCLTSGAVSSAIHYPVRQARGTMRKDTEVHSAYYTEGPSVLQAGRVR